MARRLQHFAFIERKLMKLKNILNEGMGEKFIKALSKDAKVSPDDFKKNDR